MNAASALAVLSMPDRHSADSSSQINVETASGVLLISCGACIAGMHRQVSQSCAFCAACLLSRAGSAGVGRLASATDFLMALPTAVDSNACCLAAA